MTELQHREFMLLKQFVEICDRMGLTYYLVCGSALGAVKYRGFIPWDDDVDVALPRYDYIRFCEKAQSMLPDSIFLQTYETDPEYPNIFAKLRDSETTFIERSAQGLSIHHGVYIDIFPLDGLPEEKRERECLEREKLRLKRRLSCVFEAERSPLQTVLYYARRALGYHRRSAQYVRCLDRLISQTDVRQAKVWCNHGNWQGQLEYAPRDQYGEGAWAEFEGLRVRIPAQYDAYLTQKYGDWRSDIPDAEKKGHHYVSVMDLNSSYLRYTEK